MGYKMRKPNPRGDDRISLHSIEGYKTGSPDSKNAVNVIHSSSITMEGVPHDVIGTDNMGNKKLMKPGKNYEFPGDIVIETPIKQGTEHQIADLTGSEGGGGKDDKIPTQSELLLKRQREKFKKTGQWSDTVVQPK